MNMKILTVITALFFVVGCQSAPYKTPYTFTEATAEVVQQNVSKRKNYSILVSDVKSLSSGVTLDMNYMRTPNVIESYTRSAWVEPPTLLVKNAIANGLVTANVYRDVLIAPVSVDATYRVDATIQKMLQTFEGNSSKIELSLIVRLVNNKSQNVIYSNIYSTTEPAQSLDAEGGVAAYNRAMKRLLPDIIRDITNR